LPRFLGETSEDNTPEYGVSAECAVSREERKKQSGKETSLKNEEMRDKKAAWQVLHARYSEQRKNFS
jgi:hypothetical protein